MATWDLHALEWIEARAFADWYRAAPEAFRRERRVDAEEVAGGQCLYCDGFSPAVVFRRVDGLGLVRPVSEADLDAVISHMQAGGERFAIARSPHAQPEEFAGHLKYRGFSPGYAWMKFARTTEAIPEVDTGLTVRAVGPEDAEGFAIATADGFGFPEEMRPWLEALPGRKRWNCVAAFDGDRAVAAGASYVEDDHVWLGFGATLESHRGRGAQSAVLAHRLALARDQGARVAAVETGERIPGKPEQSYRNILRSGFEEVFLRENWMSPEVVDDLKATQAKARDTKA